MKDIYFNAHPHCPLSSLSSFGTITDQVNVYYLPRSTDFLVAKTDSRPCCRLIRQNLGHNLSFREQFDVAVARAVAEMRILAETVFLWFMWVGCLSLQRVMILRRKLGMQKEQFS